MNSAEYSCLRFLRGAAGVTLFVGLVTGEALCGGLSPVDRWLQAQGDPEWADVTPQPVPNPYSALAPDPLGNGVVVIGNPGTEGPCTWRWDGVAWARVGQESLPDRHGCAVACDTQRGRVVAFGGTYDNTERGETWEWDGSEWQQVFADGMGPAPRANAAMAFDAARGRVVLFGGYAGYQVSGDTWTYEGTTWTLVSTQGPSARSAAAIGYDPNRERVVLFGGSDGHAELGDTWEWDGASWRLASSSGTGARSAASMAFDPSSGGRMVLFGGGTLAGGMKGDTWGWDGTQWKLLTSSGPGARGGADLALDSTRGRIVLYAGTWYSKTFSDIWEWTGSAWTLVCPSSPTARAGHVMAWDGASNEVMMFSGADNDDVRYGMDTWMWNGTRWRLAASSGPAARCDTSLVWDRRRGRAVLFGGWALRIPQQMLGDTWEWDGLRWQQVSSGGPSARRRHAAAYDANRGRVVLYGGYGWAAPQGYRGDTWEWDGTTWTLRAQTGPSPRDQTAMAYDPIHERVVLFGGSNDWYTPVSYQDTWLWDGEEWSLAATGGPPARSAHVMAWDSVRKRVVLFGGRGGPEVDNAVWEWDGAAWSLAPIALSPTRRFWSAMAFDPKRGRMVLYGGLNATNALTGDTWEFGVPGWQPPGTHDVVDVILGRKAPEISWDLNDDAGIDAGDVTMAAGMGQ